MAILHNHNYAWHKVRVNFWTSVCLVPATLTLVELWNFSFSMAYIYVPQIYEKNYFIDNAHWISIHSFMPTVYMEFPPYNLKTMERYTK